jgi:hypothetical protein
MHRASLTNESLRLSDGMAPVPAAGASRLQARCAEANAGASGLMLFGITSPCPGWGSGKFGTPCERMHRVMASNGPPPAPAPLGLADDPQAAIATAQPIATSTTAVRRR